MTGFTPPQNPVGMGPFVHAATITPSDTATFSPTRGLWVNVTVAGNISVLFARDTAPNYVAIPLPTGINRLDFCVTMLRATGTTITGSVIGMS